MKTLYKSLILAVLLTTSVTAFAARHTSISSDMLNGEWAIEKVNGKRLVSVDDDMPYLIFNTKQNLIYASDGHNTVNAFYTFNAGHSANAVKFSNVVASHNNDASSTKALVNALNNTNAYSYEEGEFPTLHLYKGDSEMLTLRKLGLSVLDGAWKVKAVRNNTIEKEDEIQLVIDTTDGRVYGNTGFNIFRGTIWIDTSKPRAIQFQNINASENETDNQRNETQLLVALEEVESIKNVKGNTVTLLDGTGKPAIVLERITISRIREWIKEDVENRVDEDCVFYMRLDKQKAVRGEYEVAHHGDVISITGKIQSHPARKDVAESNIVAFLDSLEDHSGSS